MIVYIVEIGEYSERYIDAVFLDKEKAKLYVDILDDADWSEYEITDNVKLPEVFWNVRIELRFHKDGYILKSCSITKRNAKQYKFGANNNYLCPLRESITLDKSFYHEPSDEEINVFQRTGYDICRSILAMNATGAKTADVEKWLKEGAK